jgi:hypothetical protein
MSLTPRLDKLEKNVIINGNFDFWQRGTSFTGITGNAIYHADRFNLTRGAGISSLINTVARSTDVPTLAQSGTVSAFSYSLTNTAAASNLATSGTSTGPTYHIEGNDIHRLIGKTVKLSFWVKSSVSGTYSFLFSRNFADNYVTTYTINATNTWEKKTISVYIDPSIAWNTGNARGLLLYWVVGAGTAVTTSNLNQWQIGTTLANANTATNTFSSTNGATFLLSQVMLTDAENDLDVFVRAGNTINEELAMCERYFQLVYAGGVGVAIASTTAQFMLQYNLMRTNPTIGTPQTALTVTDHVAADFTQSSANLSTLNSTPSGARVQCANFTGMTTNRLTSIVGGGPIPLDAEL